ncbi:MAG: ATP-binding protein [Rhodocyclales bacterium]|nr:ATP-binding protein [Rhodocyclales bacterium]
MSDFSELAVLTIHDVKNRLNLLVRQAERKGDMETLRIAMEAAATLTRLLHAYKAGTGRLRLNVDAHAPADVVEELAAEFRAQTALRLDIDLAGAPVLACYDEALVRMLLQDALYNAMRHARVAIRIAARAVDGFLEFSVADDGPGYPPEMLGAPAMAMPGDGRGTGLGLYLARQVAELHANGARHGELGLGNDAGAVFRLRLPL